MLSQKCTSFFIILFVLQRPVCSNGKKTTLCYMRNGDAASVLCDGPKPLQCCAQHVSVDVYRVDVYGRHACNSTLHCGNDEKCCESKNILNVSAKYVDSLKDLFIRTNCFNDVTIYQLPVNSGLVSVIVSYSCQGVTSQVGTVTTISNGETGPEGSSTTAVVTVMIVLVIVAMVTVGVVVYIVVTRKRRKTSGNSDSVDDVAADFHIANQSFPSMATDDGDYSDIPEAAVNEYIDLEEVTEYNAREVASKVRTAREVKQHTDVKSDRASDSNNEYHHIDHSVLTVRAGSTPIVYDKNSAVAANGLSASCLTEYDIVGQIQRTNESYGNEYDELKHHVRRECDGEDIDVIGRQKSIPMDDSTYSHVQHFTDERSAEIGRGYNSYATGEGNGMKYGTNRNGATVDGPGKDEPHYFILSATRK